MGFSLKWERGLCCPYPFMRVLHGLDQAESSLRARILSSLYSPAEALAQALEHHEAQQTQSKGSLCVCSLS